MFYPAAIQTEAAQTPSTARTLMWAALVFFIPFQLHYNYILNAFYHFGAPYSDAGLFANLIWHNSWEFMNPSPRGNFSYLGVHFTPFLVLVGQLSHFFPTHLVEFFAGFMGALYASLGLAMFYAFSRFISLEKFWQAALLAGISIAFSFNGSVMMGIWMPHFEYAIPLGIFLTLFHLRMGQLWLSALFLAFTLSLREDAGLHFTAVLGLLAAITYLRERSFKKIKIEAVYIAIALGYSMAAFWATAHVREIYNVHEGLLATIYTGYPPYDHLSWSLITQRLVMIFNEHEYLWLGFLITLSWAWYRRDPYLAAGFAAVIPWFLFNLTAANGNTGYLYAYYSYPVVIALGWPLLAYLWRYGAAISPAAIREAFILQAVLACSGLIAGDVGSKQLEFGPTYGARWGSYQLQPSVEGRERIWSFVQTLNSGNKALGVVAADHTFAGLSVGPVAGRDLIYSETSPPTIPVDSVAYISPWPTPMARQIAATNRLTYQYCVAATNVCLITNRAPSELGSFSYLLLEKPLM